MTMKQCNLFYEDGTSNKEYHLRIEKSGSGYKVVAEFGPRHGTMTYVEKTKGKPVQWFDALDMFEKTEREKRRKGYEDIISYYALIARFRKESGTYLSDTTWERIAKIASEYFEGQ